MSKIQLKAHGAWLGGGTGAGFAGLLVGLLQQHVTHGPLAPIDVEAIYSVVAVAGAFAGAYLLPILPKPPAAASPTNVAHEIFNAMQASPLLPPAVPAPAPVPAPEVPIAPPETPAAA